MFGQLIEIRGTTHAYEQRNGVTVEYATDVQGQTRRLRSLGCPEFMIPKVLAKRNQLRSAARLTVKEIDAQLRNLKARLEAKTKTVAPPVPVLTFNERLARVNDAVRIDRMNAVSADIRQQNSDDELRKKMQVAAGTFKGD